jgi:hypothetical protein
MALPGEVNGGKSVVTCDCGTLLPLRVYHSAAGYYIGYWCPNCGPYGRESEYFITEALAKAYLHDLLENSNTLFLRRVDK